MGLAFFTNNPINFIVSYKSFGSEENKKTNGNGKPTDFGRGIVKVCVWNRKKEAVRWTANNVCFAFCADTEFWWLNHYPLSEQDGRSVTRKACAEFQLFTDCMEISKNFEGAGRLVLPSTALEVNEYFFYLASGSVVLEDSYLITCILGGDIVSASPYFIKYWQGDDKFTWSSGFSFPPSFARTSIECLMVFHESLLTRNHKSHNRKVYQFRPGSESPTLQTKTSKSLNRSPLILMCI